MLMSLLQLRKHSPGNTETRSRLRVFTGHPDRVSLKISAINTDARTALNVIMLMQRMQFGSSHGQQLCVKGERAGPVDLAGLEEP